MWCEVLCRIALLTQIYDSIEVTLFFGPPDIILWLQFFKEISGSNIIMNLTYLIRRELQYHRYMYILFHSLLHVSVFDIIPWYRAFILGLLKHTVPPPLCSCALYQIRKLKNGISQQWSVQQKREWLLKASQCHGKKALHLELSILSKKGNNSWCLSLVCDDK